MDTKSDGKKRPEFTLHLMIAAVEILLRQGVSKATAIAIGHEMVEHCCKNFGGRPIYIPKNQAAKAAEKATAVYQEFNGSNYRELAKKYDLSEAWVRALVKMKYRERGRI